MRSNAIRMSAKGEECTFQIVGVCNHNPETTVLCHLAGRIARHWSQVGRHKRGLRVQRVP